MQQMHDESASFPLHRLLSPLTAPQEVFPPLPPLRPPVSPTSLSLHLFSPPPFVQFHCSLFLSSLSVCASSVSRCFPPFFSVSSSAFPSSAPFFFSSSAHSCVPNFVCAPCDLCFFLSAHRKAQGFFLLCFYLTQLRLN